MIDLSYRKLRNRCADCGKDISGDAEFMIDIILCAKCLKARKDATAALGKKKPLA